MRLMHEAICIYTSVEVTDFITVVSSHCVVTDTIGTEYNVLNREVSSFQGFLSTQMMYLGLIKVSVGVLNSGGSLYRGVPLYIHGYKCKGCGTH